MVYAGFWRRFAAHIIDSITLSVMLMIVLIPLGMIIGGVLVGQDLVNKAKERAQENAPQSQLETVQRIVPLSSALSVAQALPPATTNHYAPGSITVEPTLVQPADPSAPAASSAPEAVMPSEPYPATLAPAEASPAPESNDSLQTEKATSEDTANIAAGLINIFSGIITCILGLVYHPLFIGSKWQATPGKRVMGCIVVSREGQRITRMHALGRHLACILSWLPFPPLCIGFFLAGWTREKTALHDMIADTRVVRVANEAPVIAVR